jgi:uncharacterized protein (TIGR03083 family)
VAIDRVGALRREREALLDFLRPLSPGDWDTPSKCPGWSVKDVVSHMAAIAHGVFTPWMVKLMRTKNVERAINDADVEIRRGREPAQVVDEYERWSRRLATVLRAAQRGPLARVPMPMGDIGRYPMVLIPSAIVFDTHTHLRHDLVPALDRPEPDTDPERVASVLEWMVAGIPQMCRQSLAFMDRPLTLTLEGPGGGTWSLSPRPGELLEVSAGRTGGEAAHVSGIAIEFPAWGTTRAPWRDQSVKLEGDEDYAARFLDALKII